MRPAHAALLALLPVAALVHAQTAALPATAPVIERLAAATPRTVEHAPAAARATFDHPAFAARRVLARQPIDTNRFLVQPPASVEWRTGADAR